MQFDEWLNQLNANYESVADSYAQLCEHITNITTISDITDDQKDLAIALITVKSKKLHDKIIAITGKTIPETNNEK